MSWANPLNGRLPEQKVHDGEHRKSLIEEDKSPAELRIPSVPSFVESDDDGEEVKQ